MRHLFWRPEARPRSRTDQDTVEIVRQRDQDTVEIVRERDQDGEKIVRHVLRRQTFAEDRAAKDLNTCYARYLRASCHRVRVTAKMHSQYALSAANDYTELSNLS